MNLKLGTERIFIFIVIFSAAEPGTIVSVNKRSKSEGEGRNAAQPSDVSPYLTDACMS